MIQYGLISETDARCLEKTIDLICSEFPGQDIHVTEIGIFDGQTSRGINEYITSKQYGSLNVYSKEPMQAHNFKCNFTAIDNNKDKEVLKPFEDCTLIIGNSTEVYNALADNSQHMIFVDANHSFPAVIADFFCYESKVKKGGYFCFHDTGKHIKNFTDYQRMGSGGDLDMYISVRKALHRIGVLSDELFGWRLIYDEADENDRAGGIVVLKKIHDIR